MAEIKYYKPPLLCVVVSIQFEKVANFSDCHSHLLESFPKKGFTVPDSVKMNNIEFQPGGDSGPKVKWHETTKWDFKDPARTTLIRIDENGVAIHFADYQSFGGKSKILLGIFEILDKAIPSLRVQRYGIRYINHIPVTENEDPSQWINPAILGLPNQPSLGLKRVGSVNESIFESESGGQLVLRCSTMGGGLTVPPDLFPIDLKFGIPLESETPFIRVENVHLLPAEEPFGSSVALDRVSSLRQPISRLFTALTTQTAHQQWQLR